MAGLGFSPHLQQDGLGLKRPLKVKGSKGAKWVNWRNVVKATCDVIFLEVLLAAILEWALRGQFGTY